MPPAIEVGERKGLGFIVKEVWAVIAVHGDGDEAVPAVMSPDGLWFPLIAADPRRLAWIREQAQFLADSTDNAPPLKLVRFDTRTDLETFTKG